MTMTTQDHLHYELGVLMFNIVSPSENSLPITNQYDSLGNFQSILDSLHITDFAVLKEGFLAECTNYEMEQDEAKRLFEEAVELIKSH